MTLSLVVNQIDAFPVEPGVGDLAKQVNPSDNAEGALAGLRACRILPVWQVSKVVRSTSPADSIADGMVAVGASNNYAISL